MSRKEKYDDFDEWETDVFRAGATQVLEVGENIFYAIRTPNNKPVQSDADGMFDLRTRRGREVMKTATTIGGWAGGSGEIYRHIIARAGKARPYTNPRASAASAENMVLDYVADLDFEPSEASIQRAISYVKGLSSKRDGLFKIVTDPDRMREVRAKVMQILSTGSVGKNNPVSPKGIYTNFDEWRAAAKKAGAVRFEGGKDNLTGLNAKGSGIADWDGVEGYIYKSIRHDEGETNPVRPRRGESSRAFVSRCMSEEKKSFPAPKQRIAVCLSKSRKRNPLESGATISDDEDINRQASKMG